MTQRHEQRYQNAIARNFTNVQAARFVQEDGSKLELHKAKHLLGIRLNDTSLDQAIKKLLS
jgi:hypothetical protein